MTITVLFDPKHFRCPFCGRRCVAGVLPSLAELAMIHELPCCPAAEAAGPAVTLARSELANGPAVN